MSYFPTPTEPAEPTQALTTNLGLNLPDGLTWDQWQNAGITILNNAAVSQWLIGDWLLYAEQRLAARDANGKPTSADKARIHRATEKATHLEVQTIKQAKVVARAFPPARRRQGVPWSFHREVASCAPDLADELLGQAEEHRWSRERLLDEARAAKARAAAIDATSEPVPEPTEPAAKVTVTFEGAPGQDGDELLGQVEPVVKKLGGMLVKDGFIVKAPKVVAR